MVRLQSRQISQLHLYQVLHAVRLAAAPLSRAEICTATGLSQPAVSTLTRRLIESQALKEVGARPSLAGGRREREFVINADYAWVVGVQVAVHQITIARSDFGGSVRRTLKLPLAAPQAPAMLVRRIAQGIEACLASSTADVRERLAGVGVALPGFIDSMRGDVHWSAVLRQPRGKPVALAQALSDAMEVPVLIENDANMLALAEQWSSQAAHLTDLAVLILEHGLGLGVVLNGELYRGRSGLAAELAHVQVEADGLPCGCGKRGCLEAYVTHEAVVRQARAQGLLAAGESSLEADLAAYAELAAIARAGNARARALFEAQGRTLGQWIGNLVNLFAPQRIAFDGGPTPADDLYGPALHAAVDAAVISPERGRVPLLLRHQGDEVWARGAASLVLQRLDESATIVGSVARHGFESERAAPRGGTSPAVHR